MPRELTEDQKTAIAAAIGPEGKVEMFVDTSEDDAQSYADALSEAFTVAGWTVVQSPLPAPWIATPSGLSFMAQGDLPNTDIQNTVSAALEAAEVEFSRLDAMLPEGTDVKLMVGRVAG
jgi:hypothetical protein